MRQVRYDFGQVRGATKRFNLAYNLFANCSIPLTWLIANHSRISANALTWTGGLAGLAGSALLWAGHPYLAALSFAAFLLLDCSDGAIARLKQQESESGARLDLIWDRGVLFAAVLSRSALLPPLGQLLCAAYLCLHYITDLQWLMRLDRDAKRPAQWAALKAALDSQRPPSPHGGNPVGRIYRAVMPDSWVCNIVFLILPCLFPDWPLAAHGAALALLALCLGAPLAVSMVRAMR